MHAWGGWAVSFLLWSLWQLAGCYANWSNKVLKKGDPISRIHVAGYVLHRLVARRILETIK